MKRLAIIGAGDLGQLIAYHALADNHFLIAGFFDDTLPIGKKVGDQEILGQIKDVTESYASGKFDYLIVGIGYKHMLFRKNIYNELKKTIPFGKVIHSSCYIDKSSKIGNGSFLLPGCVIDKGVIIGENVLLNTGCIIAHDTTIGNHCFLSPAVKIAGKTEINECCNIGINSTIIDNLVINSNIQTGGGAVVINNLTEVGLYLGVPAKLKKK
jgi:sugar O-acyltransferase (sialic acid O-acetyltransferase NeuD family)